MIKSCVIYRDIFQGCLPLVLMFDMKEEIEVDPQFIAQLMEQLDVFISIKPKPKQPSKVGSVWIQRVMYRAYSVQFYFAYSVCMCMELIL